MKLLSATLGLKTAVVKIKAGASFFRSGNVGVPRRQAVVMADPENTKCFLPAQPTGATISREFSQ
jgi:hypothetical protein